MTERGIRVATLAGRLVLVVVMWRCAVAAGRLIGDQTYSHEWLLELIAAACAAALLLGRPLAIELAVWAVAANTLIVGDETMDLDVRFVFAWVAIVVVLFAGRKWLFAKAAPQRSQRTRDLLIGTRITLAILLLGEIASAFAINKNGRYGRLIMMPDPVAVTDLPFVPGRLTFSTLGSSPANFERVTGHPFTILLRDRFPDRFNFLHYNQGGVNSHMLLNIVKGQEAAPQKPDAFLIYAGIQDYSGRGGVAFLRELDLVSHSSTAAHAAQWTVRQSKLLRLTLYLMKRHQYELHEDNPDEVAHSVLSLFSKNLETIIGLAAENKQHVFVATVISSVDAPYYPMLNDYLRGLPARFPNVTVVDFAKVVEAKYPEYPHPHMLDCSPFEPVPGLPGQCGDPVHMGPDAHKLLADTLEPVLVKWADSVRPTEVHR